MQIEQLSSRAAVASVLLFFTCFMRRAIMWSVDIACRIHAVLAGFFL